MAAIFAYQEIIDSIYEALQQLGGGASNNAIKEKVIQIMNLDEDDVDNEIITGQNELDVKLTISKTLLKINGIINNPSSGFWEITSEYKKGEEINSNEIFKSFYDLDQEYIDRIYANDYDYDDYDYDDEDDYDEDEEKISSDNEIIGAIYNRLQSLEWKEFEDLVISVLNSIGFELKPTPLFDDGIDAEGVYKTNNEAISDIKVAVQCKRWKEDSGIGLSNIREFRATLLELGYERGIYVTTSYFTTQASTKSIDYTDTKPGINLIDGAGLAQLMFNHQLGYKRVIPSKGNNYMGYEIDEEFFALFDQAENNR